MISWHGELGPVGAFKQKPTVMKTLPLRYPVPSVKSSLGTPPHKSYLIPYLILHPLDLHLLYLVSSAVIQPGRPRVRMPRDILRLLELPATAQGHDPRVVPDAP